MIVNFIFYRNKNTAMEFLNSIAVKFKKHEKLFLL